MAADPINDPIPDLGKYERLAIEYAAELSDPDGNIRTELLDDRAEVARLTQMAKQGGLGHDFLVTDGEEAIFQLNREKIRNLFIRYRTRIGNRKFRGMVPLSRSREYAGLQTVPYFKGRERPWVWTEDDRKAAIAHARASLVSGIDTGIRLHGAALVARGEMSWEELRAFAHKRVDQVVDDEKARRS